jgi:small subunit ribosomal protein S8
VLQGIQRVSKPGHRVYAGATNIGRVRGGIGVSIVSTSEGVMTDRDARRRNVGGEVLCKVW